MINQPENIFNYLFAALLFLLSAFLFFWGWTLEPLGVERLFFEAAASFDKEGAGLIPFFSSGGIPYPTPFLPYWTTSLGHWLLPSTPLGFRLFFIFSALVAIWGFYNISRKYLDARTAFYSCCVLVASFPFCMQLMLATPASLVAIFICTALLCFYAALKTRRNIYLWGLYGSLAAAVLCHGLAALYLPLTIIVVYLMFKIKMHSGTLQKLEAGKGLISVFLLTTPVLIYAGLQTDGSLPGKLFQENYGGYYLRQAEEGMEAFYYPFLFIILLILPLGVFLPASFSFGWKYKVRKDLLMLACLSLLAFLIYYAFSDTFYPHALLPALPFSALLIGYYLSNLNGRSLAKMKSPFGLGMLLLVSFTIPTIIYLRLGQELASAERWAQLWNYLTLGVLPVGTILSLFLWQRKRTDAGLCLLSFTFFIFNSLLIRLALFEESLWNQLWKLLQ